MKISGIYIIKSIRNPIRIYVGSSVDIPERWREHIKRLRKDSHENRKLQNHYNKYGESDLTFSVIEKCIQDKLIEREQFFIDSFMPYFNIRKIAHSNLGLKYTKTEKMLKYYDSIKGKPSWNKGLIGYRAGRKDPPELCRKHREDNLRNGNRPPSRKGVKYTEEQKIKAQLKREKNKLKLVS